MEKEDMTLYEDLREVAALRHSFHIDGRLRLEFLSTVSRLLREYEVPVSDRLLGSLVLAVPDELDENGHANGFDSASLQTATGMAQAAVKRRTKPPKPPKPAMPPVPPKGTKKGAKRRPRPPVKPPRPPRPPRPPKPPRRGGTPPHPPVPPVPPVPPLPPVPPE